MAHIPTDSFNVTFPQSLVKSLEDDISGPIQLLQTPTALIPSPVPLSTESEDLLEGLPPLPDEVMQDVSSADPTKLQCRLQSTEQFTCEVNPASDSPLIDGLLIEEDTVQSTSDLSTSSLAVLGDVGGIETESI